ncbi:hypothetical protein [uncultured Tenacibaculum sp.]|uniref:hypothetical protein n=1 Tax=uncultured Tenacibaculum sp. TaxID=174713 RepID=UPI002601B4FD|nr:hypothetical protein [uncultured Tenacibaculum sp.]
MIFSKTLLGQTLQTLGWLFFAISLGLFLDSKFIAEHYYHNTQHIITLLIIPLFLFLYYKATSRTRELLIYATLIAIAGEYLFSKTLGMYTYRLKNIPHYIPPGHAIVFLLVYYFSRKSQVKYNRKKIEVFCTSLIIPFSLYFLILKNDILGFVCTFFVFYFLRKHHKERLFFLVMYCVVAITELIGTSLECWQWPSVAFNKLNFLPSANPPAGISLFYFGLDRGTMSFYKRRHKAAWKRLKKVRSFN